MMRTQPSCQDFCLSGSKIAQLNGLPDVEWRDSLVTYEIAGCGDAKKTKTEPLKTWFFGAAIIAFANPREKLVSAELLQAAYGIYFIDEDHQRFPFPLKVNFPDRTDKSVQRTPPNICVPIRFHF